MCHALFDQAAEGRHTAESAGTAPAEHVHQVVVQAMRELGLDLSSRTPKRLTGEMAARADVVVTMGCGDECPYIPGKIYVDWDLADPADEPLERVREIRQDILGRIEALLAELDDVAGAPSTGEAGL